MLENNSVQSGALQRAVDVDVGPLGNFIPRLHLLRAGRSSFSAAHGKSA